MDVIERNVEEFIDAWAHDYANDDWRALSAEDQIRVGGAMMEKALELANYKGAVDRLRELADAASSARERSYMDEGRVRRFVDALNAAHDYLGGGRP